MLFKFHNTRWNPVFSFLLKTQMFSRKLTLVIYNLECGFFRDRHAQMGVTLIIYNFGGEIFDLSHYVSKVCNLFHKPTQFCRGMPMQATWGLTFFSRSLVLKTKQHTHTNTHKNRSPGCQGWLVKDNTKESGRELKTPKQRPKLTFAEGARFIFWYRLFWVFWLCGWSRYGQIVKKSSRKDAQYQC